MLVSRNRFRNDAQAVQPSAGLGRAILGPGRARQGVAAARKANEAEGAGRGTQRDLGSVEKQDHGAFQLHAAPRECPGGLEHDSDVRQIVGSTWRADGRVEMRVDEQRVLISKESRRARALHASYMSMRNWKIGESCVCALLGSREVFAPVCVCVCARAPACMRA